MQEILKAIGALLIPAVLTVQAATIDAKVIEYEAPVEVRAAYEKDTSVIIRINWTHDRIVQELNKVFPDAPIIVSVAMCEGSRDKKHIEPFIWGPTQDVGPLQIHVPTHKARYEALGLDVINNPADNIAFGRILYDESGLAPWSASKPCWSKLI